MCSEVNICPMQRWNLRERRVPQQQLNSSADTSQEMEGTATAPRKRKAPAETRVRLGGGARI